MSQPNKKKSVLWETNIRKARQHVQNYSKVRFVIADLALEACDSSHGGRKSDGVFSLARFAVAIELCRKTLYEWIAVKKYVVDKLPKNIQEKTHLYNYEDFVAVRRVVESDTPDKEVVRRFEEQMKRNPEEKKFSKYIKHLNSILYNVQRPMIMKDVPSHLIDEVIEKANLIQILSGKELSLRATFKSKERQDLKRMNVKDELAKRIGRE